MTLSCSGNVFNRSVQLPFAIVCGLGNPGKQYMGSRHNVGADCLTFALSMFETIRQDESPLFTTHWMSLQEINGLNGPPKPSNMERHETIELMTPKTFMNLSGKAMGSRLGTFSKEQRPHLIVVYDDMDLPFGSMRIRLKGSSGGHKGIHSIIETIGFSFMRLRLGIGKPKTNESTQQYVLSKFSNFEAKQIPLIFRSAWQAIGVALLESPEKCMSLFNANNT